VGLGTGLPFALGFALNFIRPDLTRSVLEQPFGHRLLGTVGLLSLAATALYLSAWLVPFRKRTPRVLLTLAGALLCTLPALLLTLFGPVVIALMYSAP
jgi:hypothetical protein